jgi:hypothetical protein
LSPPQIEIVFVIVIVGVLLTTGPMISKQAHRAARITG